MNDTPVAAAVTRISASATQVWRVLVAFDEYARWHPTLALGAKPDQAVAGVELPARVSDGEGSARDVTLKIVGVQAPHRLVWEGGSLDTVLGRHSFVLAPQPDGTTELTDSEEFFGPGADQVVPVLDQLSNDYARNGAALRARVEGG